MREDQMIMQFTPEQIHSLVFQAAGVGSGAVMREAPQVEMPSEEITAGLNMLLNEFDVPPVPGYLRIEG